MALFFGCCTLGGAAVSAAPTKQEVVLPQKARNAQNLLAEKSLPQMAQIYTEVMVLYGGEVLWENISQKVTTDKKAGR